MSLFSHLSQSIGEAVVSFLTEHNIEFFIGGSRRFNYNNEYSDIDIFVNRDNPSWNDNIRQELLNHGFDYPGKYDRKDHSLKEYPSGTLLSYCVLDRTLRKSKFRERSVRCAVHIVLLESLPYAELKEEHNNIDIHITAHPEIVQMAKSLKRQGVRGSQVYRGIKSALFDFEKK